MFFNKENIMKKTERAKKRHELEVKRKRIWYKYVTLPRLIKREAKDGSTYILVSQSSFMSYAYLDNLATYYEGLGFNAEVKRGSDWSRYLLIKWKEEEKNA